VAYKLLQNIIDTTGIPVMQKAVLAVLARHSLEDGTNKKSPSVQTLGDKAGMCAKAARVALRGLEEGGWIIALGKKSGGRKVTTHYLIVAGRFEPDKTRHDSPPFNEETSQESRYHVPPNGHDPACETRHEMPSNEAQSCETRYDSPLNPVPRTAEEVLEEKVSTEAEASGAVAPSGGTVVAFPMSDKARLYGPVLAGLTARLPDKDPREISAQLSRAFYKIDPQTALDLGAMAAVKDEPWSWLCAAITARIKPKPVAGGRPIESGAAEFLELFERKKAEMA